MIQLKIATKLLYCKIYITSWSFFTAYQLYENTLTWSLLTCKMTSRVLIASCGSHVNSKVNYCTYEILYRRLQQEFKYITIHFEETPPYCTYTEVTFSKCSNVFCIRHILSELNGKCLYTFFSMFDNIVFSILYFTLFCFSYWWKHYLFHKVIVGEWAICIRVLHLLENVHTSYDLLEVKTVYMKQFLLDFRSDYFKKLLIVLRHLKLNQFKVVGFE